MAHIFGHRERPERPITEARAPGAAPETDAAVEDVAVEDTAVEDAAEEWGMEGSGTDPDIDPELAEAAEERAAARRRHRHN